MKQAAHSSLLSDTFSSIALLPPLPGNTSIKNKLVDHLSHRFPESEHKDFNLTYRLFSDTSSQLPGSDAEKRGFTHILASSHDPRRGYVRSTRPGQPEHKQSITIAAESIEPFANLISSKLQPLWHPRQNLVVDDGISVSLRDNQWILSIGDVKTVLKSVSSSMLRGTLIDLHYTGNVPDEQVDKEEITRAVFRDVMGKIFHGTGETFEEVNLILGETLSRVTFVQENADWELAHIYMKALGGHR